MRLIRQWLQAGVLEDGKLLQSEVGSPQGASVSPLAANIYLYYVLDLWGHQWRQRYAQGDVHITRYVDDIVMGFEKRQEAEQFLQVLSQRLADFGLALHPSKTRLIEFGRFARERRQERGLGKPETFNFLGFTHVCGWSRSRACLALRRAVAQGLSWQRQRQRQALGGTDVVAASHLLSAGPVDLSRPWWTQSPVCSVDVNLISPGSIKHRPPLYPL